MIKKISSILLIIILTSCSVTPGMHMVTNKSFNQAGEWVYIESIDKKIEVKSITDQNNENENYQSVYRIGNGDQISITVWGLPEIFPISNISPDQNLRRVDSNGNIFFPYAGVVKAEGKTQNQLRDELSSLLANFFTDPQIDVSVARFNSQKIYLLGEVTVPARINITDIPLTLADALGQVKGLSTTTSDGSNVFIIRQGKNLDDAKIYRANLSAPSGFFEAGEFYLENNDIVYVNAKSTTRWNRVISQFFPFSSFLNSIDNLIQSD